MNLFVELKYDINKDSFDISTNMKKEAVPNIVENFLRSQIGAGEDNSEPNKLDIYNIKIKVDLSDDTFLVNHNCGNKGLRDGILLRFLKDY
jgi:hypothetical protein